MRSAVLHGAFDVRVEEVPDAVLTAPTDAVVRVVRSCVCGSDLWKYRGIAPAPTPRAMGHEFIGVIEETGSEVSSLQRGDFVIAPFTFNDGSCEFCREGLVTSCVRGGVWGTPTTHGGQGEAVTVPFAEATLVPVPQLRDFDGEGEDELLRSLLSLSDVMATGHHAAVNAAIGAGDHVVVIGDGAVGLSAVLAAKRLGAERVILLGRHADRTELGRLFGATDIIPERGEAAVDAVRELLPSGAPQVLEAVGSTGAWETAIGVARHGGVISYVGVPHGVESGIPLGALFAGNISIAGGVAPARTYIPELLQDVLNGTLVPAPLFDKTFDLAQSAEAYQAMDERTVLKAALI